MKVERYSAFRQNLEFHLVLDLYALTSLDYKSSIVLMTSASFSPGKG